ncbi:uncharacterized protein LOC125648355 [Ostrea edulis]|uniref:uncharacterized protein LOC125648355 n=1 Tax=Ostrea edulis TaxID=37623 RepID=UPI0020964301|nr:uncharacterized protein LOC125648355 [Ostrea edulis]
MVTFRIAILALVFAVDHALGAKYRIFAPRLFKVTWEQARRNCQNIGIGWDLVKIQSRSEDLLVKDMLKCERALGNNQGWFIGGISKNGKWTYADGSRMTYTAFGRRDRQQSFVTKSRQGTVINYAAIFHSDLAWDYLTTHDRNSMGYVCEAQYC